MKYKFFALSLIAALLAVTPALAAAPFKQSYKYNIKLLNLSLGTAMVKVVQGETDDYSLLMTTQFAGIVTLFANADGRVLVNGALSGHNPTPVHADAQVRWDEKLRHTIVDFENGDVKNTEIIPPYKYNPKKRVPLDPATLFNVKDPLTAMMRPLEDGKVSCNARLQIFDGRERYDMVFHPTKDPWTCRIEPINISGYDRKYEDPDNKPSPVDVTFMAIDENYAIPKRITREMALGWLDVSLIEKKNKDKPQN